MMRPAISPAGCSVQCLKKGKTMSQRGSTAGAGWVAFAAIMMIIVGVFGALEGLAAIVKSGFYHVPPNYYVNLNAKGWGWIHLIIGIIVALAAHGRALAQG